MSLFDRRTDTEKELDAYRKSHPSKESKSSFDTYNNNSDIRQNNTESDNFNYKNENYNNLQSNKKNPKSWVISTFF